MINEVSEFLVGFIIDNKQKVITHKKVSDLVINCLDLLSEASIGPCFENQVVLINNKRLLDVINEVIRIDLIDFDELLENENSAPKLDNNRVRMLTEVVKVKDFF